MNKTTVTSVAGYFTVALFLLLHSLPNTGFASITTPSTFVLGMGTGSVLIVLAVLSWLDNQPLDSVVFFLVGLMILTPVSLIAFGSVLWLFVIFLGLWMVARSHGVMRFLFLLLLDLALLLMLLAGALGVPILDRIGAIIGMLASFAALYYALGVLTRDGCGKKCMPLV